jgi:hypothetical protein
LDRPRWRIAYEEGGKEKTKLVSTHDLLFAGDVDDTTRRRKSPFSNTLVLPGFNLYEALKIDDPKKLAWKEHLFDLRGRHLEQAVLYGADLTKADLTGAFFEGASLNLAQLQGASLEEAQLKGASLRWAKLQGASLARAQLQGAWLFGAQLQGASLYEAHLQGATLDLARLEGASLLRAQLQGASLYGAQLQGASLDAAKVSATGFSGAFPWRTDWGEIDPAKLGAVRFETVTWKPAWQPMGDPVPWDAKAYVELRDSMNSIPEGERRDDALKRIEILDCENPKTLASCDPAAKPPPAVLDWQKTLLEANVDDAAFARALAKELGDLVCANDTNAIYILRGIARGFPGRERLAKTSHEAAALVDFIMSKDCPVSASLTADDNTKLLKIKQDAEKKFAPPPASNKE